MTSNVLDVFNAALSAVRGKGQISSLSESSIEREECSLWYDLVRDQVQEAAYWPSSTSHARLALLAERNFSVDWVPGDPPPDYQYSYALPNDFLRARHLVSFERFTLQFDGTVNTLATNTPKAVLTYSSRQELVSRWAPAQKSATIFALAARIAGALTGKTQLVQLNNQLADKELMAAREASQNSISQQIETIPDWISARGYAESAPATRYFYPLGKLFSEARADG